MKVRNTLFLYASIPKHSRTGPDRIESKRTLPQYNRIPVNVLCAHAKTKTLNSYWSTKMDNVKLELLQPIIMKGFERMQTKKSFALPLLHLTSSIFPSACLTFALCLVLCCASTVLCVALTWCMV